MTGFECGIKNNTSSVIKDWKLELEIEGIKSADGWNGTYTVGTNKLTITPADYNKEIQPGGNISLGANMGTSGKLNVKSAKLNGKDVKAKIETAQSTTIHIAEGCDNLIREMPMYEWKKDRNGELLDEPKKVDDHSVDALCYAIYGVRGKLSPNKPASNLDMSQFKIY